MKILYQSVNYERIKIARRYLHIDLSTGIPVVSECGGHHLTLRRHELPESEFARYSKAIAEAEKIKTHFPYMVDFIENETEQNNG